MKYQPLISKGWTMYMLESMSKKNIDIATEPASGILGNGSYDKTIRARWT
jgi:hypothetical protein